MYHKLNIPVIQGSKSNKVFKPNLKTGHYSLQSWALFVRKLDIHLNKTGHTSQQNWALFSTKYKSGSSSLQRWM
jgi:hypothetical protein